MRPQETSFHNPQPRLYKADAEMSVLASLNKNYFLKQTNKKKRLNTRRQVSLVCIWLLCFVFSKINTNILKYLRYYIHIYLRRYIHQLYLSI